MNLRKIYSVNFVIPVVFKLYIPTLGLLLCIALVSYYQKIPIAVFTKDPAVVANCANISPLIDPVQNPFIGIVSQIGILCWCLSTCLCLFCSKVLCESNSISNNTINFLSFFGCFSLILLLDDLFLLHESIFPNLLNIPEQITYLCYAIILFGGLLRFGKKIIETSWYILAFSFIFFGFSMIVDLFSLFNYSLGFKILLEDGAKFLGIVTWSYYLLSVCGEVINTSIKKANRYN